MDTMLIPDVVVCDTCGSEVYYVAKSNTITCTNCDAELTVEVTELKEVVTETYVEPPTDTELLQQDVGALLLESAADKAKIAELETLTGALLLEIAALKGGIA